MAKWKKKLKKAAKVAVPLLGALALAKGLGKRKSVADTAGTEDLNINVNPLKKWSPSVGGTPHIPRRKKWTGDQRMVDNYPLFRGGGIAKRGTGVALKSGGRVKSMGIAKRGGGAAKR